MPSPPPCETARASSPPETPAIGAPMTGVVRSNQRVSGVLIMTPSCLLLRRRTALVGALQAAHELVAALGAGRVLLHHLAEEARDVGQARVLGVPDVLAVVVACLEGVVLDGDQVVEDVLETGFSGGHVVLLGWERVGHPAHTRDGPIRHTDSAGGISEKAPPVTSPPPASS